ncbi:hypothetical protein AVEN_30548-1 [Araneus ventricosus]|uniref:Uncharacterized protein n=1 Tax=Araneus ventricosus TaxID=182803 RepID=A0A4Y2VBG8_ARAVE|nr:hypothetical protein AVEN_30548-1 [Araneus ventricosus]
MRSLKVFLKAKEMEVLCKRHMRRDRRKKRRTVRRKKIMPGEKAAEEPLTLDQELKRSMLECIDRFQQEINTRKPNFPNLYKLWLKITLSFLQLVSLQKFYV